MLGCGVGSQPSYVCGLTLSSFWQYHTIRTPSVVGGLVLDDQSFTCRTLAKVPLGLTASCTPQPSLVELGWCWLLLFPLGIGVHSPNTRVCIRGSTRRGASPRPAFCPIPYPSQGLGDMASTSVPTPSAPSSRCLALCKLIDSQRTPAFVATSDVACAWVPRNRRAPVPRLLSFTTQPD